MGITSKLCNPTPFDVSFNYDRGIVISIPSDGHLELSMEQIDDFRPGKAGSEEVRQILDFYGLFLLDGDRSYDVQALQALRSSLQEKKRRLEDFTRRLQDNRIASGRSIDDSTIEMLLENNGYGKENNGLAWQVAKLESRISKLSSLVDEGKATTTPLDPKITCFATKPPRVFASPVALRLFLEENPEIAVEHNRYVAALKEANNEQAA